MEIEAKPKLGRNYVQRMLQYVISAGTNKMDDDQFQQFVKNAEAGFLDDMQQVAEVAFEKGREFERRNNGSQL